MNPLEHCGHYSLAYANDLNALYYSVAVLLSKFSSSYMNSSIRYLIN